MNILMILLEQQQQLRRPSTLSRQQSLTDQDDNMQERKQRLVNPRPTANGQQRSVSLIEGGSEGKQPPLRQRRVTQPQGSPGERMGSLAVTNVNKDCFVIPEENLERFLPDGITVSLGLFKCKPSNKIICWLDKVNFYIF